MDTMWALPDAVMWVRAGSALISLGVWSWLRFEESSFGAADGTADDDDQVEYSRTDA